MTDEAKYFNSFNLVPQVGPKRFQQLLDHFSDLGRAWKATGAELAAAGFERDFVELLVSRRATIDADREYGRITQEGIGLVTIKDNNYPRLLQEITDPPAVLYVKGNLNQALGRPAVAVVGTRKISSYGKMAAENLAAALAHAGVCLISGLALGVDGLVHRTALANSGATVAVLGSGLNQASIYPGAHRGLSQTIVESGGAVISEFPIGSLPLKQNFPRRNRIISGLALGVLVIEADLASGSLITARHALEQNRQVFAVPGPIFNATSAGTNNLLKLGAKPVTSVEDILSELNLEVTPSVAEKSAPLTADSKDEEILLKLLNFEPVHVNTLIKASNLPASVVSSTLLMMELKGKVRNLGALQYVLAK
ncbi:MAG: DNA-protecting protein DprA [Candidatus Doudnabacteria bacterium]|nr:DNA-protecting protein DprA [Candidatus Doudnabacteria bacterium]